MISAFGVEHYDISKMSDRELRHRKRVQAGLSTAGAVVGLSALGAKGAKVGAGKYLKPAAKAVKINTKIDNGVNNALVVGGGIGGAAGLNSASISRAESKKPQYIHKLDTSARGSNQHKRQVRVAIPRVTPKQRRHTALAASTGMLAGAGLAAGGNKKKLAVGLIAGGSALSGYAASDPNDYIKEKKVAKSAFGVEHIVSKAFDPERRRHTQLGAAAGVSGSVAAASGASAVKSAHKARSHFRAASGTNETTKSRMLEGLGLKGAAQAQHARKTAIGHGEMLQHIRAGNTAARRARGKAGVALGTAAAAGAIVHHSNNGAANYVGPYQPKAKYAQGAKKTVARVKRSLSS